MKRFFSVAKSAIQDSFFFGEKRAIQDSDLLKILQSEIDHELSSNRFQVSFCVHRGGDVLGERFSSSSSDLIHFVHNSLIFFKLKYEAATVLIMGHWR